MKPVRRLISGMLSLLMVCSLCLTALPATADAAPTGTALTGSIGLTIRFDLPQTAAGAAARNIRLQVSSGGQTTVIPLPQGMDGENALDADISVSVKNTDGAVLINESRVGYYEVVLSGLPAGGTQYDLALTGDGYKTFSRTVTLDSYSQHMIVGTGDGTFSLGDVNGDGVVDDGDLAVIDAQLGQRITTQTAELDLNGDGQIDITDLAYVNRSRNAFGQPQLLDTTAIVPPQLDAAGLTLSGSPDDLFQGDAPVTVTPGEGKVLELPILFSEDAGVVMSEIRITCPDAAGAVQAGTALVELANGTTLTIPFDATLPQGVQAVGRNIGERTVSIDLGSKVAVKKVTIQVTATAGQTGFATVTKIEFLKDIVPDNPQNEADKVKGLTTTPGNGQVALNWGSMPNVTGYIVAYGTSSNALTQTAASNTNHVVVSGLENLKTYYFQVTAVNGDWTGTPSRVVSAMPQPNGVPGAPSNIRVTESDQSLRLSWGSTKDASYYQVFYRTAGERSFRQFGGDLTTTAATITGLTNGTTYEVAVKAGNQRGTGPYSATASGTPKKEELVMPNLPTEDRIDNSMVQSVVMENPGNVNRSLCPNFTTADVIDNDAATYWVANQWWVSSRFTYTFKEPQDMNYAILVPYLGGNHKYALNTYTVVAKNSAGETILAQSLYSARSMDPNKNYIVLTFPMLEDVKELSISLNEREGNGCRVSISDMAFYKSDSLAEDVAALFADGSFTTLRPGVTQAFVDALSARLEAKADFYLDLARLRDELKLASALLKGDSSGLGLVSGSFQSRSATKDSQYGQSASDFQPLGVTARAGSTVAVYASLPTDAPVYVVPTQYFGESGVWRGTPIKLENGRNYIYVTKIGSLTDERGGPLYLTYAGNSPKAIKIQIRVDQNAFTMPVLELSNWYDMDETARRYHIRAYVEQLQSHVNALGGAKMATDIRNVTEISTPSVLLSIPADRALAGLTGVGADVNRMVDTMYQGVLAWEDELYIANQVQGIVPAGGARTDAYRYPMTTRQNIRYMRMFAGAFMYAAGNHVGVGYGSTQGLVCGRPVSATGVGSTNGLFGWGIAHEIGHNMDKLGKAEITNNIYALAIQAWDGASMVKNTRLTTSNIWPAIYAKTAAGRSGAASNVFVQLGMYWQLHLAYDTGAKPLDFYNRFFTIWKSGKYSGFSYDERVALAASEVANRNLTAFFTRWGMILSDEVKNTLSSYPAEPRAVWYLNDESYAYRLNNGAAFQGTVTVSSAVKDNEVTLTISGGNNTVLGYEVRRNGKPIGFTTGNTYTDNLGAANNLTYTYSVVPVDKLGNMGAAAAAPEVRVAYDKTISASLYTVSAAGDGIEFTMRGSAVPVAGLKVSGGGLGGCTVSVKENSAAAWKTVNLGPVDGTGTLAYFAKPGAAGDSRIWLYDVYALRVTGLPAGAGVELLDYPGDRIDLYEGASVGRLAQPLVYDGGVVPAGTVVIVGTYRGDPVYNTVEIQARYNTTAEAQEENGVTSIERAVNGYSLLYAEIPADGAVSDTSDGFWVFVPDWEAEKALNASTGVTADDPIEFRVVFYRTDDPNSSASRRVTSETLWVSFPQTDTLPQLVLTGEGIQ